MHTSTLILKKALILPLLLLIALKVASQAPESFKYQAVLRDARGNIKANTSADITIDILQGAANGVVVYTETHKVTTDGFGLVNLELGKGTANVGAMSAINWGAGIYFVRVSVDGVSMGTGQLLSVPYALYAAKSATSFSGDYNDLVNKPFIYDGTWASLTGKPTLSAVAISGDYNDLIGKPTISAGTVTNVSATAPVRVTAGTTNPVVSMVQASALTNGYLSSADWTTFNNKSSFDGTWSSLSGKPSLSTVALTGVYNDLINSPTGNNPGDMQYWNGSTWITVPAGLPGQYLELNSSGIPEWMGTAYPALVTAALSAITQTTATAGGTINTDGGGTILTSGVCWSLTANPTVENSKTTDGTTSGTFTSNITGLAPGTTYYVRSYATNGVGTTYGNEISFTTISPLPTISTVSITDLLTTSAKSGGIVTSDAGLTITGRGICWNTSPNPTMADYKTDAGTGQNSFVSSMEELTPGTTYYVRAYVITSGMTTYGNELSFTSAIAYNTTPWEAADSVSYKNGYSLVTCNDYYLLLKNSTGDSVFVMDIYTKKIIQSKKFTINTYSVLKGNVLINPESEYSLSAYNISDIQNWVLIGTYSGLAKGILYWQFHASRYDDNFYYWIGHWDNSVQIFEVTSNSVIKHNKFIVGVHSQSITRLGNILYVSNNYGNNRRFDVTNPDSPLSLGDFGNNNSNASGTIDAGFIIQNHYAGWGGGTDNIKIYNLANTLISTKTTGYIAGSMFYIFANGYCLLTDGTYKIFNVKNGTFDFVRNLPFTPLLFNSKFIISMSSNKIYLVNKPQ